MYRDIGSAPSLLEAERIASHRIASHRIAAAYCRSGAIPAITPARRRGSSFFARSTRLLAREIARIASRQYLDSCRVAKRNGRRRLLSPRPPPLFSPTSLLFPPSLTLLLLLLFRLLRLANVISAIMFTHTLLFLPPRRHDGHLPLHVVTPRRRRYEQSRFLSNTRARDQETRPRSLVAHERVLDSPRFVRVLSVIRGASKNAAPDVRPSIVGSAIGNFGERFLARILNDFRRHKKKLRNKQINRSQSNILLMAKE